ncbi:MAG: hypothetical protein L0G96_16940, partial [Acinetobacter sp.]|nr:hypothetical protein [Acinetobacter sp.]
LRSRISLIGVVQIYGSISERVTQQLANRVKELNERYEQPLPQITQNVEALSLKVAEHLKAMGLEW